jgi:hypothetical protein
MGHKHIENKEAVWVTERCCYRPHHTAEVKKELHPGECGLPEQIKARFNEQIRSDHDKTKYKAAMEICPDKHGDWQQEQEPAPSPMVFIYEKKDNDPEKKTEQDGAVSAELQIENGKDGHDERQRDKHGN